VRQVTQLISSGHRADAVDYHLTEVGVPADMRAQMRQSPMWPQLEDVAHTFAYDLTIMGDTQQGDPLPLRKWASVTVPTLVMDGTVLMGREDSHAFLRHGAQEPATILPQAQRRILDGQDHGPADEVLASTLKEFLLG